MALRSVLRVRLVVLFGCQTAGEVVVVETAVRIVALNQATRRGVVLGNRQQQRRVVIQLERKLYETFAKRRLADDERAIVILKRAGDDLGCRSSLAVNQHDDRPGGR